MTIDFTVFTDGDLCLDKECFDRELRCVLSDKTGTYTYNKDFEYFSVRINVQFDEELSDKTLGEQMFARDFTEAFVKSIRFNHMFLMRYLYELSEKVRHWAFHETDKPVFEEHWSGNYDGTEFIITR
jgi:hypothetical protein